MHFRFRCYRTPKLAGLAALLSGVSGAALAQPASPPKIKVLGAYYALNRIGRPYVDATQSVGVNCDGKVIL